MSTRPARSFGDRPKVVSVTEVRGATALVTGATGGLGRAIAGALRAQGCSVVLTGRRREPLETTAAELGGRAVLADLGRPEDLTRLVQESGPLDIVVMNAALPGSGELQEWDNEQIDRVLQVNLAGPIALTRALLPEFLRRGAGHFVFIGSLSAKASPRGAPLYAATKFGLRGFAHGLRCDLQGTRIGCSLINPGFVSDAGMFHNTGLELPPGLGLVSAERVTRAVVRSIRSNRAEVDVAPLTLKAGTLIGSVAPRLSSFVQAHVGADFSRRMVAAQRAKRD